MIKFLLFNKNLIWVFLFTQILSTQTSSAQWESLNGPMSSGVYNAIKYQDGLAFGLYNEVYLYRGNGQTPIKLFETDDFYSDLFSIEDILLLYSKGYGGYYRYENGILQGLPIKVGTYPRLHSDIQEIEGNLLVSTSDGLYLSKDTALTWEKVSNISTQYLKVFDSLVFAGRYYTTKYKTGPWQEFAPIDSLYPETAYVGASIIYNGIFFATYYFPYEGKSRLFLSYDSGETWVGPQNSFPNLGGVNFTISNDKLFIIAGNLLYQYVADRNIWVKSNSIGKSSNQIFRLVFYNDRYYVTTKEGLHYSEDEGNSWKKFEYFHIPGESKSLACAADYIFAEHKGYIKRYDKKEETWEDLDAFSDSLIATRLFYHKDAIIVNTQNGMVYYSLNQGESWVQLSDFLVAPTEINYTDDKYLVLHSNGSYFLSNHITGTWLRQNWPDRYYGEEIPFVFTEDSLVIFHTSRDSINIWSLNQKEAPLEEIQIPINSSNMIGNKELLISINNYGYGSEMIYSQDFGKTWKTHYVYYDENDPESSAGIYSVQKFKDFYIGRTSYMIFFSLDGINWTMIDKINVSGSIRDVKADESYIYKATSHGVYRRSIQEIKDIITGNTQGKEEAKTLGFSAFPNPSGAGIFMLGFGRNIDGKIIVSDVLGNKYMEFVVTGSQYELRLPNLKPGLYYATIMEKSGESSTVKLVVR